MMRLYAKMKRSATAGAPQRNRRCPAGVPQVSRFGPIEDGGCTGENRGAMRAGARQLPPDKLLHNLAESGAHAVHYKGRGRDYQHRGNG